jgi:anthranilate phosphoribosyltransferase
MDTCGTGGKAYPTLNVSTLSAFVVASFGVKVAKHGNRSFRNALGSAQVLERLGVNVALDPDSSLRLLEEVGVGFFLAPAYHPAMQAVKGLRAKLPFRTLFNLLGPLTNPLPLTYQVVGVYDSRYVPLIAECLKILGRKRASVVYGEDGQDELSLASSSILALLQEDGRIERMRVEPEDFGVSRVSKERLILETQEEQLEAFQRVIEGNPSPWLELVALNAGLALFVRGLAGSIKGGYGLAKEALLTRSALGVFERFKKAARGDDPVSS